MAKTNNFKGILNKSYYQPAKPQEKDFKTARRHQVMMDIISGSNGVSNLIVAKSIRFYTLHHTDPLVQGWVEKQDDRN